MKIAEIGALIIKGAKAVAAFVAGANVTTLASIGVGIGIAAVAAFAVVKYIKDRKQIFTDEANKSVVDRSLQLNYQDVRNQEELHPLMDTVHSQLVKDLYPKKAGKKNRKSIIDAISRGKAKRARRPLYGPKNSIFPAFNIPSVETPKVNAELDWFLHNYKKYQEPIPTSFYDNGCLRRVWDNTRPELF